MISVLLISCMRFGAVEFMFILWCVCVIFLGVLQFLTSTLSSSDKTKKKKIR